MHPTVAEIAFALGATVAGDGSLRVVRAAEPAAAGPDDLAMAMDENHRLKLKPQNLLLNLPLARRS